MRAASRAASGTTQGETEVRKDLPRKGPRGTYSQAWRSRADQSLTRQTPKTWSAKSPSGTGVPSGDGVPTTKPTSASMSRRCDGPKVGTSSAGALRCPDDRGAGDRHGAGPAVVADRQVLPVGGQRRGVRAEHPAEVLGMVLRA